LLLTAAVKTDGCNTRHSFIYLFSNKGPKGLLQVATKYSMTLAQYLCVYSVYIHTFIYRLHHTYTHIRINTRITTQVLRTVFKI